MKREFTDNYLNRGACQLIPPALEFSPVRLRVRDVRSQAGKGSPSRSRSLRGLVFVRCTFSHRLISQRASPRSIPFFRASPRGIRTASLGYPHVGVNRAVEQVYARPSLVSKRSRMRGADFADSVTRICYDTNRRCTTYSFNFRVHTKKK